MGITSFFDGCGAAVNEFEECHTFTDLPSLCFTDLVLYPHVCDFAVVLVVLPRVHFGDCDNVQRLPVPELELVTDYVSCLSAHESEPVTVVLPHAGFWRLRTGPRYCQALARSRVGAGYSHSPTRACHRIRAGCR